MPRRILLLITDLQIGGTPTVVRELAIRLNQLPQTTVDVACLAGHGPVVDQLREAGVEVFSMGARGARDLGAILRLARLVNQRAYDTVFSFLVHANTAAAAVVALKRHSHTRPAREAAKAGEEALLAGDICFIQSIQTTQPRPKWHWKVQSLVQHAAWRIVVPSASAAHAAHAWADVPPSKIVVIPNAIEQKDFAAIARPEPQAGGPIPIGFIGRLDPIKRIPDLLEAVRLLKGRVHLHLFGDGAERSHIEATIRALGIASRVTMHGAITRPQDALARIALLVLPSAAEGFGLVLIEAMAAGVPVVATNVPGICDVVRDGQTGLLAPAFAPPELAAAIGRLLNDDALRQRLIAQARQEVNRRFSWEAVLPRYRVLLKLD